MEINFEKINEYFGREVIDTLTGNGATDVSIYSCNAKQGEFVAHITYNGYKFTVSPNTTGEKYNYATGHKKSNGYQARGYMAHLSVPAPSPGVWCQTSSVSLESLFKKLDKDIKSRSENLVV